MNAIIRQDARCRYCDKQKRDHLGAEAACPVVENTDMQQTFLARKKRPAASNSFTKAHADVLVHLCKAAVTGQPLTPSFLRSKPFREMYDKALKMQKRVLQLEQEEKESGR